jgi:hypothetical protein
VPYALEVRYGAAIVKREPIAIIALPPPYSASSYSHEDSKERGCLNQPALTRPDHAEAKLKLFVTSVAPQHSTSEDRYSASRPIVFQNTHKQYKQGCATGSASNPRPRCRRRIGSAEPLFLLQAFKADCMHADCRLASRFSAFARRHLMGWWCGYLHTCTAKASRASTAVHGGCVLCFGAVHGGWAGGLHTQFAWRMSGACRGRGRRKQSSGFAD